MAPRIYTRTGDAGTTGIHGGARVPKDNIRIEANGDLDELNCHVGVIRSMLAALPEAEQRVGWDDIFHEIQRNLMTVMSLVATPASGRDKNPNELPENLVTDCEAQIDALSAETSPALHFLLPGGTPLTAQLQLARAVCRRAERRLWSLHRSDPLPEVILQYINRLSDLLFVMARCELARQDWPEERWKAFAYKNQR
jgi:ATP:cob(I)alamin adenosyltransferase